VNSIVCLKQVPDTEAQLRVKSEEIGTEGVKFIISPYDEYGVEAARTDALKQSEPALQWALTKLFILMTLLLTAVTPWQPQKLWLNRSRKWTITA